MTTTTVFTTEESCVTGIGTQTCDSTTTQIALLQTTTGTESTSTSFVTDPRLVDGTQVIALGIAVLVFLAAFWMGFEHIYGS